MNILYLCPKPLWERRVSASRRHDVEAVARHPDVTLRWSGVGWPDWDNGLSGVENVRRIMPEVDAVWGYKIDGIHGRDIHAEPIKDYAAIGESYLMVEKFQECWWTGPNPPPAWRQAVDRNVGLCILSHPNDRPRLAEAEKRGVAVEVILHCAEARVFGAAWRPWEDRDIAVLLTGTIGATHYPLRTRWKALVPKIEAALGVSVRVHPRPPHRAGDIDAAEAYVQTYATLLGRAKLVLGCSSRHRYNLARFPEAAAAGAVHVSDVPEGTPFLGLFVPVKPTWQDDDLVGAVRDVWGCQELLRSYSEAARDVWYNGYTQRHFAQRFVAAVEKRLEGKNHDERTARSAHRQAAPRGA